MGNNGSEAQPERIPFFIRRQLENPPVLPGENKSEFNTLFREIEYSAEGGEKTAADYAVDYQATVLIWNLQRIDRMMVAVIRHMHPAAVAALLGVAASSARRSPARWHTKLLTLKRLRTSPPKRIRKRCWRGLPRRGMRRMPSKWRPSSGRCHKSQTSIVSRTSRDNSCLPSSRRSICAIQGARRSCAKWPTA